MADGRIGSDWQGTAHLFGPALTGFGAQAVKPSRDVEPGVGEYLVVVVWKEPGKVVEIPGDSGRSWRGLTPLWRGLGL